MEILIWLGIAAATAIFVWMLAPYHERLIGNRPINTDQHWD